MATSPPHPRMPASEGVACKKSTEAVNDVRTGMACWYAERFPVLTPNFRIGKVSSNLLSCGDWVTHLSTLGCLVHSSVLSRYGYTYSHKQHLPYLRAHGDFEDVDFKVVENGYFIDMCKHAENLWTVSIQQLSLLESVNTDDTILATNFVFFQKSIIVLKKSQFFLLSNLGVAILLCRGYCVTCHAPPYAVIMLHYSHFPLHN